MADISLIPKKYKAGFSFKTIFSKIGVFMTVLVLLSLLIYGGLFFYGKSLKVNLEDLKIQAEELNKKRDVDFEKEVILLEKALGNLKIVLKNHLYWSNLFSKLEQLTVPQLSFSDFRGTIESDGSISLSLEGNVPGYTYLAKQMVSLGQEELVSNIEVSSINLGTKGGIEFVLNINFLKDILLK